MAIQIDTKRLPTSVEASAQYLIRTKTFRTPGFGGGEDKFAKQRPQICASLTVGPNDAKELMALFRRQIGPRWAFACKDHSDFEAVEELLEVDDDGNYPLIRDYGDEDRPSIRRIILPIEDTIEITVDDTPTLAFTIVDHGKIRPDSSWGASVIRWSGEHDFPAQFDSDEATIQMLARRIAKVRVEVCEALFSEAEMNEVVP